MKIAFCTRSNFMDVRGGDTIQTLATRDKLQANYGIEVDIVTDAEQLNCGCYDICHLFNIQRMAETEAYMKRCKTIGTAIALSTVLWDFSTIDTYNFMVNRLSLFRLTPFRFQLAATGLRLLAKIFGMPTVFTDRYREYLKKVVINADLLLPNSTEEADQLVHLSGVAKIKLKHKIFPVVNAVSSEFTTKSNNSSRSLKLPAGSILQVGRIEPGKNQYSTILAMIDLPDIPLVFVGNQRVNRAYFKKTEALGQKRGNVLFIEEVVHESLPNLYRQAKLHVLPSLGETTGLVSLEALANGCRAVVADNRFCPFKSYFSGIATPVNPLDVSSIRNGIMTELATERDMTAIGESVRSRFSWDEAARQTYNAYNQILNKSGN